jgi:NADH/F420H2 dehydrogenase subunit C
MDLMKDSKTDYMTNEALQNLIGSWIPDPIATGLEFTEEGSQFLNITVQPDQLHQLMSQLKNNSATEFDYLFCLSGVDWGEDLGVVYHLESTKHRHIIVVKVQTADRENPAFDTVSNIWATAEFHEREVFDFFGIKFNNHPNLKRLFLTDEWDGYPLRKDYEDAINMVIK